MKLWVISNVKYFIFKRKAQSKTTSFRFLNNPKYYCIKGIARGYLNSSPFEALMLAIIMQTIFRIIRIEIIGNPIIMKHSGMTRTIYKSIESWKFNEAFPFSFTQVDSSFLDNQQIKGPIIPPKGNKKPAKAER